MAIQFLETNSRPQIEMLMTQPTPDTVGAAAIHILHTDRASRYDSGMQIISDETAATMQEVAFTFKATNPHITDRYKNGRATFSHLSQVLANEERVFMLSDEPGAPGDFFTAIALNPDDRMNTLQILSESAVCSLDAIPMEEVKQIEQLGDELMNMLTVQHAQDNNDGVVFDAMSSRDSVHPDQIAKEIYGVIVRLGINKDITLDQLRSILPGVMRELQKIGKNHKKTDAKTFVSPEIVTEALIRKRGRNIDHEAIRKAIKKLQGEEGRT